VSQQRRANPNDRITESGTATGPVRDFFASRNFDNFEHLEPRPDSRGNGHETRERDSLDSPTPGIESAGASRERLLRLLMLITLLALIAFAVYIRAQFRAERLAIAELKSALTEAGESHRQSNRADVSLGGPAGKLAELITGPASGEIAMLLNFFNSGRTAARHFAVVAWSNAWPGVPEVRYRQRFRNVNSGEVVTANMSAAESSIPAGSAYVAPLASEWSPTKAALDDLRKHPGHLLVVSGVYEYCDAFGQYHCGNFSARYMPSPVDRFTSWLTTPCHPTWPTAPPAGTYNGKPIEWVQLERCEQPSEVVEAAP
jgi:hypothetical protein